MGSIYKRGNVLWIQYYTNGVPVRESAKTKSVKEAKALLAIKETEVFKGEAPILQHQKIKLCEIFDDLATFYLNNGHKAADRLIPARDNFLNYFGQLVLVKDITPQMLDYYISHWKALNKANATINRELAILRKALNLAREHGKVSKVPQMPHLNNALPREEFLEWQQYLLLLREVQPYLQLPVVIGYYTGMREGEILDLRWTQVDFLANIISLKATQTKTKQPRFAPFIGEMKNFLQMALTERNLKHPECEFVCSKDGHKIGNFTKAWKSACKRVGIPKFNFHDLRHTALTNMINSGIPEKVAMTISGHRTREVFDRYCIIRKDSLEDAGKKLEIFFEKRHRTDTNSSIKQVVELDVEENQYVN